MKKFYYSRSLRTAITKIKRQEKGSVTKIKHLHPKLNVCFSFKKRPIKKSNRVK